MVRKFVSMVIVCIFYGDNAALEEIIVGGRMHRGQRVAEEVGGDPYVPPAITGDAHRLLDSSGQKKVWRTGVKFKATRYLTCVFVVTV